MDGAQTQRARVCSLLIRASDTTLSTYRELKTYPWLTQPVSHCATAQPMKATIRILLLVTGAALTLLFLLLPNPPKAFHLLGWIGLLSGYFLWLSQSYKKKAILHTRGGPLIYEKQPRLYVALYILMLLLGIFMIVVLLLTNLTLGQR